MDSLYINVMDSGVTSVITSVISGIALIGFSLVIAACVLLAVVAGGYCGWYIADTIIKVNRRNS